MLTWPTCATCWETRSTRPGNGSTPETGLLFTPDEPAEGCQTPGSILTSPLACESPQKRACRWHALFHSSRQPVQRGCLLSQVDMAWISSSETAAIMPFIAAVCPLLRAPLLMSAIWLAMYCWGNAATFG